MDKDLLPRAQLLDLQSVRLTHHLTPLTVRYLPSPTCSAVWDLSPPSRALLTAQLSLLERRATPTRSHSSTNCRRTSSAERKFLWWMKLSLHQACSTLPGTEPLTKFHSHLLAGGSLVGLVHCQKGHMISVRRVEPAVSLACLVPEGGGREENRVHREKSHNRNDLFTAPSFLQYTLLNTSPGTATH